MRRGSKTINLILVLAVGLGFILYGLRELHISQRLAAEGKATQAQVLDKRVRTGSKSSKSYYLEVRYRTDAGQTFVQSAGVSSQRYERTQRGDLLPIHYLPSEPNVFAIGATVRPNYLHLCLGLVALLVAAIYHFFGSAARKEPGPGPMEYRPSP